MAPPREHVDLVGDPCPRAVDEVEERDAEPGRGLLDPDYLLHRPGTPGARLHRRVVGHHRDPPPAHGAEAGDHPVGRQVLRQNVGEQPVLDERAGVEEEVEALPDGQLVLLPELGQVTGAARQSLLAELARPLAHAVAAQGSRPAL